MASTNVCFKNLQMNAVHNVFQRTISEVTYKTTTEKNVLSCLCVRVFGASNDIIIQ